MIRISYSNCHGISTIAIILGNSSKQIFCIMEKSSTAGGKATIARNTKLPSGKLR
jgi:hypothetical protein